MPHALFCFLRQKNMSLSTYLFLLLIVLLTKDSLNLTCDEALEISTTKNSITLASLQSMQPKEIIACLAHLGKEKMQFSEADYIWQSIKTYYGGVPNVPEKILIILHWVTPAITPEDYSNITLSSIDVVQNFGLDYELSADQLSAIADRIREEYGKDPEDFTYYDLMALRQILCAFNVSEIERIHGKAFKEASAQIGKLKGCGSDVMKAFATLAVKPTAFGPPEYWDETITKILGAVTEFVPKDAIGRLVKKKT